MDETPIQTIKILLKSCAHLSTLLKTPLTLKKGFNNIFSSKIAILTNLKVLHVHCNNNFIYIYIRSHGHMICHTPPSWQIWWKII